MVFGRRRERAVGMVARHRTSRLPGKIQLGAPSGIVFTAETAGPTSNLNLTGLEEACGDHRKTGRFTPVGGDS